MHTAQPFLNFLCLDRGRLWFPKPDQREKLSQFPIGPPGSAHAKQYTVTWNYIQDFNPSLQCMSNNGPTGHITLGYLWMQPNISANKIMSQYEKAGHPCWMLDEEFLTKQNCDFCMWKCVRLSSLMQPLASRLLVVCLSISGRTPES